MLRSRPVIIIIIIIIQCIVKPIVFECCVINVCCSVSAGHMLRSRPFRQR